MCTLLKPKWQEIKYVLSQITDGKLMKYYQERHNWGKFALNITTTILMTES